MKPKIEVHPEPYEADVCLIVEGCYPYIRGGVSSWLEWLMTHAARFDLAPWWLLPHRKWIASRCMSFRSNLTGYHELHLHEFGKAAPFGRRDDDLAKQLAEPLVRFFSGGGLEEFAMVGNIINASDDPLRLSRLMGSVLSWDVLTKMYEETMPQTSFFHYFWAWRALFGGMFAAMKFPLPSARVYHTISTGYAGLLAARARLETGRPVLITEHGIYTNERRIEILMGRMDRRYGRQGLVAG